MHSTRNAEGHLPRGRKMILEERWIYVSHLLYLCTFLSYMHCPTCIVTNMACFSRKRLGINLPPKYVHRPQSTRTSAPSTGHSCCTSQHCAKRSAYSLPAHPGTRCLKGSCMYKKTEMCLLNYKLNKPLRSNAIYNK